MRVKDFVLHHWLTPSQTSHLLWPVHMMSVHIVREPGQGNLNKTSYMQRSDNYDLVY